MSRSISLNARRAGDAQQSAEIEIALVIVEHPDIVGGPVRLSSDPTKAISLEPYTMGTRSTWRSGTGADFLFTMIEVALPGEGEDAPSQASLVVEILDSDLPEILTGTTVQGTCHMAVVLASSPNLVEAEWLNMKIIGADIDAGRAALQFSSEPITDERYPADRMTKERFPGLHR